MLTRPVPLPGDDTRDVGWRLRQLRLRRGLSLNDLAARTHKHPSQISRIERPKARPGQPKAATVRELLDALNATPTERSAVFHVEQPALSADEIANQVRDTAAKYENESRPVVLLDEHWNRWYFNKAARAIFGLTPEEYELVKGQNSVGHMADPSSPIFSRYPEDVRTKLFSWRVAAFQLHFANQQFDRWYLQIAKLVSKTFWAYQIWQAPPDMPDFPDRQPMILTHPQVGRLVLDTQINQLMRASRFSLVELEPSSPEDAAKMAEIWRSASPSNE